MSLATIKKQVAQLQEELRQRRPADHPTLAAIRREPARLMTLAGLTPDPWQVRLLSCPSARTLLLCSRQAGKSTASASLALHTALVGPSLVLLLSPSQRQSGELFRKVCEQYGAVGRPVAAVLESASRLELANGSRIISLPGTESTVRSFSAVALLIVDEASRVDDALYKSVRPMLAVSKGRLVALSTPFIQSGWFYDEWHSARRWDRVRITAHDCPRISAEFLEEERQSMGPRWFAMEYLCDFQSAVGSVFDGESIRAAARDDVQPLPLTIGAIRS